MKSCCATSRSTAAGPVCDRSWNRCIAWLVAGSILCLVAGCAKTEGEFQGERFSSLTGVRFPHGIKVEKFRNIGDGKDGPTTYLKLSTDEKGLAYLVRTLQQQKNDGAKAASRADWTTISTTHRLGITDHSVGIDAYATLPQPPTWWKPDSLRKMVAAKGHAGVTNWSLIAGEDTRGKYTLYIFFFRF